jgi:hypothetical protein
MSYIRATKNQYAWHAVFKEKGITVSDFTTSATYAGTKSGQNVPHWRASIKAGSSASSPYTRDDYSLELKVGTASWAAHDNPALPTMKVTQYSGSFKGMVLNPSSAITHLTTSLAVAEAAALKQLYNKVAQERAQFQGMEFLGELGDTIRMFRNPFRAIATLTHGHITRLVKSQRGLRGTVQQRKESYYEIVRSTYLEYVFGLRPLISDVKAIAETIARWNLEAQGIKQSRTKLVGRGEDVKTSTSVNTGGAAANAGFNVYRYNTHYKTTTTRRVQYVCGYASSESAPAGSVNRLLELSDFNLAAFVPTIYEVMPWSWLIDYVSNVGDIIEAGCTVTSGISWISKTVLEQTVEEAMTTCKPSDIAARLSAYSLTGSGGGTMGGYNLRRTSMVRTVPLTLGIPPLVLSIPAEPQKYLNAFAAIFSMRPASAFQLKNPY